MLMWNTQMWTSLHQFLNFVSFNVIYKNLNKVSSSLLILIYISLDKWATIMKLKIIKQLYQTRWYPQLPPLHICDVSVLRVKPVLYWSVPTSACTRETGETRCGRGDRTAAASTSMINTHRKWVLSIVNQPLHTRHTLCVGTVLSSFIHSAIILNGKLWIKCIVLSWAHWLF